MEPPDDPLGEAVWTVLNKTAICSVYFLAQASAPLLYKRHHFHFYEKSRNSIFSNPQRNCGK